MKNIRYFVGAVVLLAIGGFNLARAATLADTLRQDEAIQQTVSEDGSIQMMIFEKDFDQLFADAANGQLKGYIKGGTVKVYDGYAEAVVVALKPITAKIFARVAITARDGKLYPKFLKTRYGFMPVPAFVMNFLISKLAGQDYQNFQKTGVEIPGTEWQLVDFKKGQAIVKFKQINK
ncbi:MAG: hypothetical protein NTZ42_02630 [Candidatus Gribaldobacteria bacterium]|nr:hypothetical protein [Candidatus Gribaldobacteria bacterium]